MSSISRNYTRQFDSIEEKIADAYNLNSNCFDVCVQDQTSPPLDLFFVQASGTPTTLVSSVAIDENEVTVVSSAGCEVGGYFALANVAANRQYFGEILAIDGNTITLDTPFDFAFQAGDTALCVERDMNVDGSTTRQIYSIIVGSNATVSIDITRIMITIITDGAVDLSKFGDIAGGLSKGLVLRRVNGDTRNIWNIKNNGELSNLCFDFTPYSASNPAQGKNGASFRFTFAGQDKHGVAVRIAPGEALQLIIQDNLESLIEFRVIGEGHLVED